MKKATLKELKDNLSTLTEIASKGETVEITRYNRPYIILSPTQLQNLTVGRRVGLGVEIKPLGRSLTKGLYLSFLEADRDG